MLRFTAFATATMIATMAVASSTAFAIDKGPCDHCTMEPIVVKGERPKKKTQVNKQQLKAAQPTTRVRERRQ